MVDYESMTIEQLKAEGHRVESLIADMRKESRVRAVVLDRKLKLKPVVTTPNDQVVLLGGDIVSQLKALPPALYEQAKAFFTKEEK